MHGRIFGGFLMRRSYELAFSTAYAFIGKKPTFDEVDDIAFMVPVNVGDLCLFDSRVLYTLPKGFEHGEGGSGDGRARVFIEVIVLVASPETVSSKGERASCERSVDVHMACFGFVPEQTLAQKDALGRTHHHIHFELLNLHTLALRPIQ